MHCPAWLLRDGVTTEERDWIKALEREVRELRQSNEILRKGKAFVHYWSEDSGRMILPTCQLGRGFFIWPA
jgi:hypothetical protein